MSDAGRELPLSHNQKSLWFLHQLAPESPSYNVGFVARVRSRVDVPALRRALEALMVRHPTLRTTFARQGGDLVQRVHEPPALHFEQIDASQWDWPALHASVAGAHRRPFNLESGPLLRVTLYGRADDDFVLLLALHHIVCDGWSLWLLLDELRVLYPAERQGVAAALPPAAFSYAGYVQWQARMLASAKGEHLWRYWQSRLGGELPVLNLPADRRRPLVQTYNGASHPFKLPATLAVRLTALSLAEKTTLFTTLAAAFQVLLFRYTGQEDLLIGSVIAGRSRPDFARLVGDFMNPVVLRSSLAGNPSFRAFLARTRRTVLEALLHQDFPFSLLVERLQVERDPSRSPLYQVLFNFLKPQQFQEAVELWVADQGAGQVDWGGLTLEPFALAQQEGQMDLTLDMVEGRSALFGIFKYNPDLFNAETIQRMEGHFRALLEGIVAHPGQSISELPLLGGEEKRGLMVQSTGMRLDYPIGRCVHHLFEEQVKRTPDAVAIAGEDGQVSYRELNRRTNRLARYLRKLGVGPEVCVGICLSRSADLVVGLLGVLKAGGAYVPLDPGYPADRLEFMLRDARVRVVLTDKVQPAISDPHLKLVRVDGEWDEGEEEPGVSPGPNNLAYVIYTSGSTGQPKGVAIEHRNAVAFLSWVRTAFEREELSGVLASTSICFDLSVFEIFAPLTCGGTVIMVENALALTTLPKPSRVTLLNTVPSAMAGLLSLSAIPASVRVINLAGERLPADLVQRLYRSTAVQKVHDLYGPSECTTYSTWALRTPDGPSTIGCPIANTEVYIADACLNLAPTGVAGEMCIGGDGVARGYLNRPDLTAERFILHSFDGQPAKRFYRTGDLARRGTDGNIEFLGRADHQVKVRGYRIELGEIECVLARHAAVREAVAVLKEDLAGDRQIVAYVAAEGNRPTAGELREYVKTKLPGSMVPARFVVLDALPLTPNGKVDRAALPDPAGNSAGPGEIAGPRDPIEDRIAAIWTEVLGHSRFGVHDSFFDLGGHSLKAARVVSRLRLAFQSETPLRHLFEFPTIAELSAAIRTGANNGGMDSLLTEIEGVPEAEAGKLLHPETAGSTSRAGMRADE